VKEVAVERLGIDPIYQFFSSKLGMGDYLRKRSEPMGQVSKVGDECPKCNTEVILRNRPNTKNINQSRTWYYSKYLYCPKCKTQYFQPEYIVYIKKKQTRVSTPLNRSFKKEIMILFRECPDELKTKYGNKIIKSAKTLKWW